jgi:hypothetical protein
MAEAWKKEERSSFLKKRSKQLLIVLASVWPDRLGQIAEVRLP